MGVMGRGFRLFRQRFSWNVVHHVLTFLLRILILLLLLKGAMKNLVEFSSVQSVRWRSDGRRFFVLKDVVDDLFVGRLVFIGDVEDLLVDLIGTTAIEDANR